MWITGGSLDRAMNREEGSKRPVLVLLYSSGLAKDCCAANFERAVFRYKPMVDFATRNFTCYKYTTLGYGSFNALKRLNLDKKKPAILLLDAEGGVLHKQQYCIDPKKFLRIAKSAARLNAQRVKLKKKYMAMRREARASLETGEYSKALRTLDRMLKKRDQLSGHVLLLVEDDRAQLEVIGNDLFEKANQLRGQEQLLDAYRLYKEVQDEFSRLKGLSREARRCARDVASDLKKMGITAR